MLDILPSFLETMPYKHEVVGSSPTPPTSHPSRQQNQQLCTLEIPAISAGCLLPLNNGFCALLDSEDFERFGRFNWTVGSFGGKPHYAYRSVWGEDGKCHTICLHRAIMDAQPGQIVDHKNRNTYDNRKSNLRFATKAQNRFNSKGRPSKHGFIGVDTQTPGAYRGRVMVDGKTYYTSTYRDPVLAAAGRDLLAIQHHGEFAVLNFKFEAVS